MSTTDKDAILPEDQKRLAEMGYKQELSRSMSGFANFAIAFTIISILSGALTLFGLGSIVSADGGMTAQ